MARCPSKPFAAALHPIPHELPTLPVGGGMTLCLFFGEHVMRKIWIVFGILFVSHLALAASICNIRFINSGGDGVVAISLATPGSDDWKPIKLRGVTGGGYVSPGGGFMGTATGVVDVGHRCVYDILVEFSERRALLLSDVDVCRVHRFDIDRIWWQAQVAS
jgi:hypothetical protein